MEREPVEDINAVREWQIAGIHEALASLDRGEGISHEDVKAWVETLVAAGRKTV